MPGLEGFDKGLEPSEDGSTPLERDPSTRISASSISSQVPPIWRKWSSPPKGQNFINIDIWSMDKYSNI